MRYSLRIIILIAIAALGVTGCNGKNNKNNPKDLPAAQPLLTESAGYIQNATSFELEIGVSGFPVEISIQSLDNLADTALQFKYAKGVFQTPDRIDANIQFGVADVSTTAELIAIDREHYFRADLLGNRWIKGELIPGFTPASLLAQPGGIGYALNSITQLQMVGRTDLDGLPVYHLSGMIEASNVHALTFGLIRTQEGTLKIDVYIQVKDRHVAQISLIDPPPPATPEGQATPESQATAPSPEPTTWKISITGYNKEVSITAPSINETK